MKKRNRFGFEDRLLLENAIKEKLNTFRDLSRRINRDKSTIHYELVRSGFLNDPEKYNAIEAQKKADARMSEQSLRLRGMPPKEEKEVLGFESRIESLEFQIDILVSQIKKIEGKLNGKNDEL